MWNELMVTVAPELCEKTNELVSRFPFAGFYIEDYSDMLDNELVRRTNLVEQELLDKVGSDSVIHCYVDPQTSPSVLCDSLCALLNENGIVFGIELKEVPEENWAENWKKFFKPVHAGHRTVIVPTWENYTPADGELIIRLDPGAAFGAGTHETTMMCIRKLEELIGGGESVLDIGTGSGILAIAAVKLGASSVEGVDIDPLAVETALENAAQNGMSDKINIYEGDLTDKVSGKFNIITANLVSDIIIKILGNIGDYMACDSTLLLSGIINSRKDEVVKHVKNNGFTVTDVLEMGEWVCLSVCKCI